MARMVQLELEVRRPVFWDGQLHHTGTAVLRINDGACAVRIHGFAFSTTHLYQGIGASIGPSQPVLYCLLLSTLSAVPRCRNEVWVQ